MDIKVEKSNKFCHYFKICFSEVVVNHDLLFY